MTVHLKINTKEFDRRMRKIKSNLDDRRSYYLQAGTVADKWIQDNFQKEGTLAVEGGWKKLSAATIAQRRKGRGKGSPKILQDTGALKSRWKHQVMARFGKIQSGVFYGEHHHKGQGGVPERPILPTEQQLGPKLRKLCELWVKGAFKK